MRAFLYCNVAAVSRPRIELPHRVTSRIRRLWSVRLMNLDLCSSITYKRLAPPVIWLFWVDVNCVARVYHRGDAFLEMFIYSLGFYPFKTSMWHTSCECQMSKEWLFYFILVFVLTDKLTGRRLVKNVSSDNELLPSHSFLSETGG